MLRAWLRDLAQDTAFGARQLRRSPGFAAAAVLTLALLCAELAIPAVRALAPAGTPQIRDVRLSAPVLAFTAGTAILAGILAGLAPAWHLSAAGVATELQCWLRDAAARGSGAGLRRAHGTLAVIELTLMVMLVTTAVMAARGLLRLTRVPLGFRSANLLTLTVHFNPAVCASPAPTGSPGAGEACELAVARVLREVRALPGVADAAAVSGIPPLGGGSLTQSVQIDAHPWEPASVLSRAVSPRYFHVLGIRLLAGREFTRGEGRAGAPVAIVNQAFARQFTGGNALGHDFHTPGVPRMTVVGEVANSRDEVLGPGIIPPEYYVPLPQAEDLSQIGLLVSTQRAAAAMAPAVRHRIWTVDADAPITGVRTMRQRLADKTATPRFQAVLLGAFGLLGLALAWIGIYGVISHAVSQRTGEIGLRMALGAEPRQVRWLVLREGMILAAAGIGLGVGGAIALSRVLRSLLFGVPRGEPATLAAVALATGLIALAACDWPARRAARLDPARALREP